MGLGFEASGLGLRIWGLGFWVLGLGVQHLGFRVFAALSNVCWLCGLDVVVLEALVVAVWGEGLEVRGARVL